MLKKNKWKTTTTKDKDIINKSLILNETSLEELTAIIDTYQTDFELPAISEEEMTDPDYWFDLLDSCSVTISDSTELLNRLDDKYSKVIQRMSEFYDKYKSGSQKSLVYKELRVSAKRLKIATDICKTQLQNQMSIIVKTLIEFIRLFESAIDDIHCISESYISEII